MKLDVINPYTQDVILQLPCDEGPGLERKIASAKTAFDVWRQVPLEERIEAVQLGLDRFLATGEETAREVSLQMGKPLTQSGNEVRTVAERTNYMISIAMESLRPDALPQKEGFYRRIEHAPLGVVFNLAAWNYPLIIPINVIVPALIAGNVILLKHSAKTPLCGKAYEDAFAGLCVDNLVTNLVLSHEETTRVIADPRVAHVAFTGSVAGGRSIYEQVAHRFIEAGLELGGKDPAYVAEDADLAFAIENIVDGACYNAGQSCCAVERAYVHRRHFDAFVEGARALMEKYVLGDPLVHETTLGPMARASALDELEAQVSDAKKAGGEILLGGRRIPDVPGNLFPPTLVLSPNNSVQVMQEESFGPILPVMPVKTDEEALEHMNDSRYGLTASIWTSDQDRAERLAARLEAGTIFQNRCDYLDPALPWTGWKDSGKGSTLSKYGFFHLTQRKAIHFRTKAR